jgi:ankyrin repeat protein
VPIPLPERPSLEQLRKQARDLQRAARRPSDDAARAFVASLHPGPVPSPLPLSAAQLVVARMYGFASWPRLVAHLRVVAEYQRVHADLAEGADPADRFLDLACLTYTDGDGPHRWAAARQVPVADADIHVAAARADAERVAQLVGGGNASADGGPRRWAPLMYLAYTRHDEDVPARAVLDTARLLLDHGADPNAGYLFDGLPTPFTVLTGVFGGGERNQPPHPHAAALAELLLAAGADPNDGQALYNRMFSPDDSHLRLLLAHGLGSGDGGSWHRRMPEVTDEPATMLREQLHWAATHGFLDRIRLLAEHGVDLGAPLRDGRTPAELAVHAGRPETVELLVALGAPAPELSPVDALVGVALVADGAAVARVRAAHPTALADARRRHPGLVVRAAAAHNADAVRLLVRLGFDVNGMGRADLPIDQPWETALHVAAGDGDVELVGELLQLGADPTIRDGRFNDTAAGWARHFDHATVAALLPR